MAERKYRDPYQEYTDATDVGADKLLLSAEQQAGISQAKADWQKAFEAGDQAGMDAAHQRAEGYRAQAGYSGGANGGAYNRLADDESSGVHMSATHMSSPKWTPTYQQERADTLAQIQSRKPFSYDPEKDPTYQQYKAQYERGAQQAMQDTMGQVMTRTGGLASSFAQTAGQQSYNATMAQLADKVPELRQLAYQMYLNEGDRLRSDLQMYDSLDSSDAARWHSTVLNPFLSDRAYAKDVEDTLYSRGRDALADSRYEREYADQRAELDYQHGRDALADSRYDQEWDYKTKLDQEARDKALAELLASGGNYSGYEGLYGMSPEDAAALGALWTEDRDYAKRDADLDLLSKQLGIDLTRKQIANYGKSSGGGDKTGKPTLTWPQVKEAIADGTLTPNVLAAYEAYMGVPYDTSEDDRPKVSAAPQLKVDLSRNIPMDKKVDAIQGALAVHSISPDEAQELLDFIGYDDKTLKSYGY